MDRKSSDNHVVKYVFLSAFPAAQLQRADQWGDQHCFHAAVQRLHTAVCCLQRRRYQHAG